MGSQKSYRCYIAMIRRAMDQQHEHLKLQWRDQVHTWRATRTQIGVSPYNWQSSWWYYCARTALLINSVSEMCTVGLNNVQKKPQTKRIDKIFRWQFDSLLRHGVLCQDHQMAFPSCLASKERGEPMSLAGGEAATVAPWHNILHHVHRLCSSWQGVQAMCWLLRDSLVKRASIGTRFKAFSSNRHRVKLA